MIPKWNIVSVVVLVVVTSCLASVKEGWTQHQNNAQHTGVAEGNVFSMPLPLVWTTQLSDGPMRPASVSAALVVVTTVRSGQHTERLGRAFCLDTKSGNIRWRKRYTRDADPGQATISGDKVFIQVARGSDSAAFIASYDLASGVMDWKATYSAQSQNLLAPTYYQGTLIFEGGTFGGMFSVDAATATENWWIRKAQFTTWAPAVIHDTIFTYLAGYIEAYDLATAEKFYRFNLIDNPGPSPASELENSFAKQDDTLPLSSSSVSADQLSGVVLDTITGIAYCTWVASIHAVDYSTGDIIWRRNGDYRPWSDTLGDIGLTPPLYEGKLFLTDSNHLEVIDAGTGEDLWDFWGDSALIFNPVVSDGYVFVSSGSNVYAVNIASHQLEWSYPVGGHMSPANNGLYLSTLDGRLLFFGDVLTDVEEPDSDVLPSSFSLSQNYPNPFNPSTAIEFSLPNRSHVRIAVYNIVGQQVSTLTDDERPAGFHRVVWNGTNDAGKPVASGVYFYRIVTNENTESKKMVLLK